MIDSERFAPDNVPGCYNISDDAYHGGIGVSASGLKLLRRSALHFWNAYINPDREPKAQTPALILGRQIHTAILEPERYFEAYYPLPRKLDMRLKKDKEDFEFWEREAATAKKEIITAPNHETCQRIAEAVHRSDSASFLFSADGLVERSFYWRDPATDALLKCRPDKYLTGHNIILDLKSCDDASPDSFKRDAYNYGYHIQAAHYLEGVEAVTGTKPRAFVFAAFEKSAPYACAFYQADAEMLEAGAEELARLKLLYAECVRTDQWPGYPDEIVPLGLPAWARR